MICPNCKYKHGCHWEGENSEDYEKTKGEKGHFFTLPIEMKRQIPWESDEIKIVYGCPNCDTLFMEVN